MPRHAAAFALVITLSGTGQGPVGVVRQEAVAAG